LLAGETGYETSTTDFTARFKTAIDAEQIAPWRQPVSFPRKQAPKHNATTNGSGELGRRAGEPAEACAFASGLFKAIGVTKLDNSLEVRIGENIQEFETGWERLPLPRQCR
jgi:hypothetical protein